jgi:hypothetical protein
MSGANGHVDPIRINGEQHDHRQSSCRNCLSPVVGEVSRRKTAAMLLETGEILRIRPARFIPAE